MTRNELINAFHVTQIPHDASNPAYVVVRVADVPKKARKFMAGLVDMADVSIVGNNMQFNYANAL